MGRSSVLLVDGVYSMICDMAFHREMSGEETGAAWRHVGPFLVWILVMNLPMADLALRYGVQTGGGILALAWFRPWRYYSAPSLRSQFLAVVVGLAVFVVWVLPESQWLGSLPGMQDLYLRLGVRGATPVVLEGGSPYAPERCGWWLSAVRLSGSAFVIAVAEEFFWRGFLMRWMQGRPFTAIDPGRIGWGVLLISSLVFGLEHTRWLVGVMGGIVYGLLYMKTRDLGAAITAHISTNLLLGVYVLATGRYEFW